MSQTLNVPWISCDKLDILYDQSLLHWFTAKQISSASSIMRTTRPLAVFMPNVSGHCKNRDRLEWIYVDQCLYPGTWLVFILHTYYRSSTETCLLCLGIADVVIDISIWSRVYLIRNSFALVSRWKIFFLPQCRSVHLQTTSNIFSVWLFASTTFACACFNRMGSNGMWPPDGDVQGQSIYTPAFKCSRPILCLCLKTKLVPVA